MTKGMNLTINLSSDNIVCMGRKRKEKTEEDIILKKWFYAKQLFDMFLKIDTKENRERFMARMGIDHSRLIALQKPGQMIRAHYADKYAISLRISSLPDMARLV